VSTVERDAASEHEVTPLELFFDLVFVFAITQVTTLLTHHPTWGGVFVRLRGWRIAPRHFAERHGLVILIALGESIVAIGVGAGFALGAGELVAAALGERRRLSAVVALLRRRCDLRTQTADGGERHRSRTARTGRL
jgi:low temperature requirement protein LtrA